MERRSVGALRTVSAWVLALMSMAMSMSISGWPLSGVAAAAQDAAASTVAEGFVGRIASTDTGGLETRSAALILSGQEGGEVPVALVAGLRPAEQGSPASGVDLWCTLAASHLLAGWPEDEDLLVEIYAYALDYNDGVAQYSSRAFHLSKEMHGVALAAGEAVHVSTHLPLSPGAYSLRLLVLLRQTGRLGMRVKTITVPAADTMAAPQVLLLQPAHGLLVSGQGTELAPGVVEIAGRPWIPQEWPDLSLVDRLFLRPSATPGPAISEALQILIQSQSGDTLRRLTATPRPVAGRAAGSTLAEVVLEPTGLPAGQYVLILEGVEGTPGDGAPADRLGVRIGAATSTAAASTAAASTAAAAEDGRTVGSISGPRPQEQAFGKQGLSRQYLQVLQLLASPENGEGALGALVAMEDTAMGDGSPKLQARVMTAELSVANYLAARQASLLEPLVVLHEEAYRHYRSLGRLLLATHSRKVTARLLELYGERQKTAAVKRLRAEIFTSQAGFLLELGSTLAARNALAKALEDDPRLPSALYLQAAIMEALGEYQRTVDYLRRLQDTPAADGVAFDDAAKLRLAINLRRLGKKEEQAEELFQQLIERPANDWVTVVAYQELATLLAAAGRSDEALVVLKQGLARLPEAARLIIQMASLLDAQGRPSEARRWVASIDWVAQRFQDTPRFIYGQWPVDQVAVVRRSLRRRQLESLPDLLHHLQNGGEPQGTS